ncbi:MAG: GIY-YIG nuclease family protein [Hyphomicrobiaceae bacterium]
MKRPCVYILASKRDGVLYIGVTSDLGHRMAQHTQHLIEGFTAKYNVTQLVYCEFFDTMEDAITREGRLKKWHRAWKVKLIERMNPEWENLFNPETGEIAERARGGQDTMASDLR